MNDTTIALEKLTRPWSDVLSPKESGTDRYIPVEYPPLLDMLDEACRSSYGAGASGASSDPASRNLINLEAHGLREHIDGTVRAWVRELSKQRPESELKDTLGQLAGILNAHHAAHTITDTEHERISAFFPRWCERIWSLFDPPTVKDLIGACPNCSETKYTALDGSKASALIAYFWKGIRPEAKCQSCGFHWSGERELLELGYHIGATQDEEALRDMGVIA